MPAFVIFNDRTLDAIAAEKPADKEGLLAVPGIGPSKAKDFGEDMLGIVSGS